MTLYRAQVMDTPDDPFRGGALRADADAGVLVDDGMIVERGPYADVRREHPGETVVDLRSGLLLPGFVDTHVHHPQVRAIGALGMPLLEWLDRCALPEEARLADVAYAREVAGEFIAALVDSGTTTALVFGSHFAPAVDLLFEKATERGLRITCGLVVGDRMLRPELHTTAQRAYDEARELARRWHQQGRTRYAVTPRFSLSCTDELLESCSALQNDIEGCWFTSHINENPAEITKVRELFGCGYLDSYDRHGLVGPHSVFAHNVHPTDAELKLLAAIRRVRRPLPDEQRRARERAVPARPPPVIRCPGGARLRCRRRHRVLAVQGGPAGVLPAAAARPRGRAHDIGPPPPPGHVGRCRCARAA